MGAIQQCFSTLFSNPCALATMAKTGKPLIKSLSDPKLAHKPSIKADNIRLQIATQKDVFRLSNREFINHEGKHTYKLTDKGSTTADELLKLFGSAEENSN